MNVTIRLGAGLVEATGQPRLQLALADNATMADLLDCLRGQAIRGLARKVDPKPDLDLRPPRSGGTGGPAAALYGPAWHHPGHSHCGPAPLRRSADRAD